MNLEKPADLSYSRVQTYQKCPWMYHLVYDLDWRSGPTSGMALGQSLHKTLGRFLHESNTDRSIEALIQIYEEEWVNEGFDSPESTIEAYESGRSMLELFYKGEHLKFGQVVGAEKEFQIPMGNNILFRGTIDRLDRLPDGRHEVVEYKTRAEGWTPERMAQDLQMTLYALGMSMLLKQPSLSLRYIFLSNGTSRIVERSSDQLESAQRLLLDIGERVQNKEYTPNHSYCRHCEFGRRCENFKP